MSAAPQDLEAANVELVRLLDAATEAATDHAIEKEQLRAELSSAKDQIIVEVGLLQAAVAREEKAQAEVARLTALLDGIKVAGWDEVDAAVARAAVLKADNDALRAALVDARCQLFAGIGAAARKRLCERIDAALEAVRPTSPSSAGAQAPGDGSTPAASSATVSTSEAVASPSAGPRDLPGLVLAAEYDRLRLRAQTEPPPAKKTPSSTKPPAPPSLFCRKAMVGTAYPCALAGGHEGRCRR